MRGTAPAEAGAAEEDFSCPFLDVWTVVVAEEGAVAGFKFYVEPGVREEVVVEGR